VQPQQQPAQATAQGVLTPLTGAAIFLVVTVESGGEEVTRALLSDVTGLTRSVGFRSPESGLTCVVGIGSTVWDRLFDGPRPAELHPFREVVGTPHRAPATPGECSSIFGLHGWISASSWRASSCVGSPVR
jgi:putative iron-dependent peroxidase